MNKDNQNQNKTIISDKPKKGFVKINKNDLAIKRFKSVFGMDNFYKNTFVLSLQKEYKNKSQDFTNLTNEKIQVFHLETLFHCKKKVWNDSVKNAITLDICGNEIIKIDVNKIDPNNYTKFMFELRRAIFGPLHYTGESFSNHQIVMGDFHSYYIQYLAQIFFGHPQIVEPFKNSLEIMTSVNNQLDKIFNEFIDLHNLFKYNKERNIYDYKIPYIKDKGFLLSIPIKISPPVIDLDILKKLNYKVELNETYWVLHVIFM